jgi:uncharacterized membrane protein
MVEYPRQDCYTIGFLTNDAEGETEAVIGRQLTTVFVPTTPNPTSGFLLFVPKEEVFAMDMSLGEGMKLLISGGAVIPEYDAKKVKKKAQSSSKRASSKSSPAVSAKKTATKPSRSRTRKTKPDSS